MLKHHCRPTKLKRVGGAVVNLENLPGESHMYPGLKTHGLGLWFLNICVNQNDLKVLVKLRFLGPPPTV